MSCCFCGSYDFTVFSTRASSASRTRSCRSFSARSAAGSGRDDASGVSARIRARCFFLRITERASSRARFEATAKSHARGFSDAGFYIGGNLGAAFDPNDLSIKDLSEEQDLTLTVVKPEKKPTPVGVGGGKEGERDCYGALGLIHSLWKPMPGRFKDFIAMPRPNGYQALHTSVVGDRGLPFEVQIRTEEMHRVAEEGIAAHWKYKEGRIGANRDEQYFIWLRQLLEWQQEVDDPRTFLTTLKIDLYLHQQGLDTTTPTGRLMYQMLSVFAEFERAMIQERKLRVVRLVESLTDWMFDVTRSLYRRDLSEDRIEDIRQEYRENICLYGEKYGSLDEGKLYSLFSSVDAMKAMRAVARSTRQDR